MTEPRVLLSQQAIEQRVDDFAREISEDYRDVDNLYMLGVLRGAFIFLSDSLAASEHSPEGRLHRPVELRR